MKTIETYLPIFPGFYSTIFEPDETDWLEENEVNWDDMDFDMKGYGDDIAKACCHTLCDELKEYVSKIKMQSVSSPKEYNFYNDSINVEIHLSEKNITAIGNCIAENKEEFRQFLKDRYTPCSGFIPSHSNDTAVWHELTSGFRVFDSNPHHLGSILEFVCQIEDIDQDTLYYGCEHVYVDEYCSVKPKLTE